MQKKIPWGAIAGAGIAGLLSLLIGGASGGAGSMLTPLLLTLAGGAVGYFMLDQKRTNEERTTTVARPSTVSQGKGLRIDGSMAHPLLTYDHERDASGNETGRIISHFKSGVLQLADDGRKGAIHLSMRNDGKVAIDRVAEDFTTTNDRGGILKWERKWRMLESPIVLDLPLKSDLDAEVSGALKSAAKDSDSFKSAVREALIAARDESKSRPEEETARVQPRTARPVDVPATNDTRSVDVPGTDDRGKVFVVTGARKNPQTEKIGSDEVKAASRRGPSVIVYLDKDFNVVHAQPENGDRPREADLAKAEFKAVVGSAVPGFEEGTHIYQLKLKGKDGEFFHNSPWYRRFNDSSKSFEPIPVQVDQNGYVDFKSPEVSRKLLESVAPLRKMRGDPQPSGPEAAAIDHAANLRNALAMASDPTYSPESSFQESPSNGLGAIGRATRTLSKKDGPVRK